ncbi:MAG: FAD-dependent oxidoreductase [Solirubrobacteraceae bacterium]
MSSASHAETAKGSHSERLRVVVVGGGVAALETALALADLGRDLTDVTVIAPNTEFVYRPMVVREPFAHGAARRYPLVPIVHDAGARLLPGELGWIDPVGRTIHTKADESIEYDALVLALGASISKRYEHALTIDDRDLDEAMHGLIQDVEGDFIHKLAFVAPGRMAWPLPLYELALMTAGRAYDMSIDLETTIVTPEDGPLAIFGASASSSIAELLARASIETITSAYAEVPNAREVVVNPGDRHREVDRVIALPELFGPEVRGIPLGDHGFIRVDPYCRVPDVERVYAAGDATDFPIKHGGVGSQQADVAAQSIAALAGASVMPQRVNPTIHGMLLTNGKPQYLTAHITGGHGFSSEITDTPTWSPPSKIAAKYLAPYLQERDRESTPD